MDVVKKAMLLGLGVISLTKEKAEEAWMTSSNVER